MSWVNLSITRCSVAILAWASFGCATPAPTDLAEAQDLAATLRPAPPIATAQLYPLVPHSGTLDQSVNRGQPRAVSFTLEQTTAKHWRLDLAGVRVIHMHELDDGSIVVTREEEIAEGVAVDYDPPLTMLPPVVSMGELVKQKSRMTVTNLTTGSPRDEGWCEYELELLGTREMKTFMGNRDTYVVENRRDIGLKLAAVQLVMRTAYVPGRGFEAEWVYRTTRPMRLFEIKQTERLVRTR